MAVADGGCAIAIDTGFTRPVAERRGRSWLRCPVEMLPRLSVLPEDVADVIPTHLHYDHVGNFDRFPSARFHLQEREIHYATGRYMQYPRLAHSFEVEDVCGIVRLNYARRIVFYDGDAELAPASGCTALAGTRRACSSSASRRSGAGS